MCRARATPPQSLPDNMQRNQAPTVQLELKFAIISLQIGTWRLTSRLRGDLSGEFDLRESVNGLVPGMTLTLPSLAETNICLGEIRSWRATAYGDAVPFPGRH